AVGTKTVFAVSDSIKTIVIGLNDTLVLSKSFGIIQFPKPYSLNKYYRLVGIENAATYDVNAVYGTKVPNFWDMYNYTIGDMFYMTDEHCVYNNPNIYGSGFSEMFKVTGKTTSSTGYTYQAIGLEKYYNTISSSYCVQTPSTAIAISQLTFTNIASQSENMLYPGALMVVGAFNLNPTALTSTANLASFFGPFNVIRFTMDINNRFTKQAGFFGCGQQLQSPVLMVDTFATLYHIVANNKDYLTPYLITMPGL
ncbi:MAG: hypothetical protein ABIP51_08730, partial [Bacteroidia bacterium]